MNASGDAAEQVVRISLEGAEFAVKIAGKGAKELAVFLYAAMQGAKRTKGKTRLAGMLRSGKELKVYSLKESDLRRFAQEAKKYGVLYAALKGVTKSKDGLVDVMVKAEDASKINRIFERFSIAAVDTAAIRSEVLRSVEQRAAQSRDLPEAGAEAIEARENARPPHAEKPYSENPTTIFQPQKPPEQANPTRAGTASSNRSERFSGSRAGAAREDARGRPSGRKQLDDLRAARQQPAVPGMSERQTSPQHINPRPKKYRLKGR